MPMSILTLSSVLSYRLSHVAYSLVLSLLLVNCFLLKSAIAQEITPATMKIGPYDFRLPPWWDSVNVEVPDSLKTSEDVFQHVFKTYGDVGSDTNWKQALKAHALGQQKVKGFPVFIAHCYMTGNEYRRAAEVYSDLWKLIDTQPEGDRDWYRCYLAHNAGLAHELADDSKNAHLWSSRTAAFVKNRDKTIAFYAKWAERRANRNAPNDPAMTSNDPEYGLTEKRPIQVGSKDEFGGPAAERAYLDGLRDEKGKPIKYERIGSAGTSAQGKPLDVYEVTTSTGTKVKLYLDMYHPNNSPEKQLAPKGLFKPKPSAEQNAAPDRDGR